MPNPNGHYIRDGRMYSDGGKIPRQDSPNATFAGGAVGFLVVAGVIGVGIGGYAARETANHEVTPGAEAAALKEYEAEFLDKKNGCLAGTAYDTERGDATHDFVDHFDGMWLTVNPGDTGEVPADTGQDQLIFKWNHDTGELTHTEDDDAMEDGYDIFSRFGRTGIDCFALGDTQ